MIVRPTLKYIFLAYVAGGLLLLGPLAWWILAPDPKPFPLWAALIPMLLMDTYATARLVRRNLTSLRVDGDLLRYETGFISKSTRTMELSKVQNVAVDQTLLQRLSGLGDLSIETAGESSRITIRNIDHPQRTADELLAQVRAQRR